MVVIKSMLKQTASDRADCNLAGALFTSCFHAPCGRVGCIFLHAASYEGMPDFLSHNASAKHLYFWLSARFVAAVPLLLVTLRSWQRLMTVFTKYLIFSALLLLTAIVKWVVIYLPGLAASPFHSAIEIMDNLHSRHSRGVRMSSDDFGAGIPR